MKNLLDPQTAAQLRGRIAAIGPTNERQWGKMSAAQAMAHCAAVMEMAVGDSSPPRMLIGRVIGGLVKKKVVGDDAPLGRNSPTAPTMVIDGQRELDAERARLIALVDRFAAGTCTQRPHTFFGPMTPGEWSILMYKHIDHHLRQFGA